MIYNLSQGLGIPIDDVLHKWSYENLLLFSRATPSYGSDKNEESEDKWDESLDANNPENFTINENSNMEDEEFIV